jgi:hypothetical protein
MVPKGRYNNDVAIENASSRTDYPQSDHWYKKSISLAIDFDKNWFRKEVRGEIFQGNLGKFIPRYVVTTFDGTVFKSFRPKEDNSNSDFTMPPGDSNITLGSKDLSRYIPNLFSCDLLPVFLAHGVIHPNPDVRPSLKESLDPRELRVHGRGKQDGSDRLVLQTSPSDSGEFDEIWVDLTRGSIVTRWLNHRPDRIAWQTDINYHQKAGEWLPLKWKTEYYHEKNLIDASYDLAVLDCFTNDPIVKSELELEREIRPGMVVRDLNKGKELYVVNEDGTWSPARVGFGDRPVPSKARWLWFGGLVCLLLIGLVAVIRYGRRWLVSKATGGPR